jgi:hypothetical protein
MSIMIVPVKQNIYAWISFAQNFHPQLITKIFDINLLPFKFHLPPLLFSKITRVLPIWEKSFQKTPYSIKNQD